MLFRSRTCWWPPSGRGCSTSGNSSDFDYQVEIIKIMSTEITCKILDKQKFAKEPSTKVTLFQGIPKQGKMELIVQKNVEIGIMKIVPVFMDRTVVVDKGNFSKKIERWKVDVGILGQHRDLGLYGSRQA